jgi:hypothetical protein
VLKKTGRVRRGAIMIGSAAGSTVHLVRGLWISGLHRRWMIPLVIFLCVTGLLLILAASVEALAPFIYSIF